MPDKREAYLRKVAAEAAKVVDGLPNDLRAAAFTRVFDILLEDDGSPPGRSAPARPRRAPGSVPKPAANKDGRVERVMAALDRTNHPSVERAETALDAALVVLKASRDEAGEEWLIPSEISRVLKDKFRHPVDTAAVRMALGTARTLVDRRKASNGYEYRIMGPGEKRLSGSAGATAPGAAKKK